VSAPLFYLGAHHPHWLAKTAVPLFVSHRRLTGRRTFPRALGPWALDSGGFTELSLHGRWTVPAKEYAAAVRRYADEVGNLAWCAPQDWMCEREMLQKTGLSIEEHQRRSVASVLELRALGCPAIPVLQGWQLGDYLDCADLYETAGINLRAEPVVGVGTVCRRQNTDGATRIMHALAAEGLRLHGFGFKRTGLRSCADVMVSADSLAWSYHARREPLRVECRGGSHKNCANCIHFALEWRDELLAQLDARGPEQLSLFAGAA